MVRLLTDENFNKNIVRGLRRRLPADPLLLELAADGGRVNGFS